MIRLWNRSFSIWILRFTNIKKFTSDSINVNRQVLHMWFSIKIQDLRNLVQFRSWKWNLLFNFLHFLVHPLLVNATSNAKWLLLRFVTLKNDQEKWSRKIFSFKWVLNFSAKINVDLISAQIISSTTDATAVFPSAKKIWSNVKMCSSSSLKLLTVTDLKKIWC